MTLGIGYTRGRKLHIVRFEDGRNSGRTLRKRYGYRHPAFASTEEGLVGLTLRMNLGCQNCLRALDKPAPAQTRKRCSCGHPDC